MEGIDAEVLITLVEEKPVLWDKTLDSYKDRNATRKAWEEVCLAINPEFENISQTEKNSFGKEVIRRWTNLRDSFAKSKKEDKDDKKSGSGAKKRKKYVFSDQLQFLNKIYAEKNTVDSLDPEIERLGEDEEPGGPMEPVAEPEDSTNINLASYNTGRRKRKNADQAVELRILKALEPKPPCSKMSFLQSLMPHLTNYSNREFLQFQMGVLNVIENIDKMKETIPLPQPSYYPSMAPYPPVHQYTSQSSPINQPQAFVNFQPPPFPSNQYAGPSFSGQISTTVEQQSNLKPVTHSTPTQKSTKSKPPTPPTSQYLQVFCQSDSSQSQHIASPRNCSSVESIYSDVFD